MLAVLPVWEHMLCAEREEAALGVEARVRLCVHMTPHMASGIWHGIWLLHLHLHLCIRLMLMIAFRVCHDD